MYCVSSSYSCQPHPHIQIIKGLEPVAGAKSQSYVIEWKTGPEQVLRMGSVSMARPTVREGILEEARFRPGFEARVITVSCPPHRRPSTEPCMSTPGAAGPPRIPAPDTWLRKPRREERAESRKS